MTSPLISAEQLLEEAAQTVIIDCRFSLADPGAGERAYLDSHIPGAHYLHLERDLSAPVTAHGGRHPLPEPDAFCDRVAELGIGQHSAVVAYDNNGFAFAARLWWMLRALGFSNVRVLDGGLDAWVEAGGALTGVLPEPVAVAAHRAPGFAGRLDIDGVRSALGRGAILVDSREETRYLGLEEPIDPVAGHIPGAVNYPWQQVSDEAGRALPAQAERWSALEDSRELVVYCGSGVTACVNLLSLALAGRADASLYAGSWSDWCSYLEGED